MSRGHMRLMGPTLPPLSCHQPQPEDAEQVPWAGMEGGWGAVPVDLSPFSMDTFASY